LPESHVIEIIDGRPNWILTEADIDCIGIGCGILGTGGGASPYLASLACKKLLKDGKKLRVLSHQDFKEEDRAAIGAFLGAPTVGIEKITTGNEVVDAVKLIMDAFPHEKVTAICSVEIGGMNSLAPLYTAALLGLPMLDADCMGRAYPEVQMISPFIYGAKTTPSAISDEKGHYYYCVEKGTSVSPQGIGKGVEQREVDPFNTKDIETVMRNVSIENGLFVGISFYPFNKDLIDTHCIKYSISRAWRLGRAILEARKMHSSPLKAIEEKEGGKLLFQGKIVHLERRTEGGYNFGDISIEGFGPF